MRVEVARGRISRKGIAFVGVADTPFAAQYCCIRSHIRSRVVHVAVAHIGSKASFSCSVRGSLGWRRRMALRMASRLSVGFAVARASVAGGLLGWWSGKEVGRVTWGRRSTGGGGRRHRSGGFILNVCCFGAGTVGALCRLRQRARVVGVGGHSLVGTPCYAGITNGAARHPSAKILIRRWGGAEMGLGSMAHV